MPDDEGEQRYEVCEVDGAFQVHNPSGRVVIACPGRDNAEQYAVLLTEAYRLGFKAGFRAARTRS
jgi:hypothetical protein